MKRVIIIQEAGRHEENKNFREALSIKRSFDTLGWDATVWGLNYENFHTVPDFNNYDAIFNVENYDGIGWVPSLKQYTKPIKLIWLIDEHIASRSSYQEKLREGDYNYVLHSTKAFATINHYIDTNHKDVYMPNCYDDNLIKPKQVNNISSFFPFGFCGTVTASMERYNLIISLSKIYGPNFKKTYSLGEKMITDIQSLSVHLNFNIDIDINYRNFETIGAGTILLTEYKPEYTELGFVHKENCLFYDRSNPIKSIKDLIDYYKKNFDELNNIQANGILLAQKHTYTNRIKEIIKKIL
jgi:hypothetical protein